MYKKLLLNYILPYRDLGYKKLKDGTELFANDKNIAPQAWLHHIYPGLKNEEIIEIEHLVKNKLHSSLKDFFYEMNGCALFLRKMSFSGLRKKNMPGIEDVWQPNSIETINIYERPDNASPKDIFFLFFSETANHAYINSQNGKVSVCSRYDATPLSTYKSLIKFMEMEVPQLFFKDGKNYLQ